MAEKTCPGQKFHSPTRATLGEATFHAFPYKTWQAVYRRLRRGSPLCNGRVSPLAGPTFLHISTLVHPAGLTRSRSFSDYVFFDDHSSIPEGT